MTSLGIFLRGLAMGAADIVPGVSGGTIAFITGIYPRLLHCLGSADLTALRLLFAGDLRAAWQRVDGNFLALLAAGIITSILTLARLLSWCLQHYPEPLWSAFFGLIAASALVLLRQVPRWDAWRLVAFALGAALAVAVALAPRVGFLPGYAGVFAAGFLAICAMILPGISGSFILLLLGMYSSVLAAVTGLDLGFIAVFGSGAVLGLLSISRLLDFLLQRYQATALALLTGILSGSLLVVWPWKRVLSWATGRDGEPRALQQHPVWPQDYRALTGEEPMLLACLLLGLAAFVLVLFVDNRHGIESTGRVD